MVVGVAQYTCTKCGKATEWDPTLGENPLCIDCWDQTTDKWNPIAARQRAYYQSHKEESAAWQRAYRQSHKEEIAAWQRAYRQSHKEESAAWQRAYYQSHKEESGG